MNKLRKIVLAAVLMVGSLLVPVSVFAQSSGTPGYVPSSVSKATGIFDVSNLNGFLGNVLDLLVAIGGLVALAFLILGGIKYVTSGGDASKAEGARKQVIAALIGLVIVIASFILLHLILIVIGGGGNNLQVPCIQGDGSPGVIGTTGVCGPS